MAGTLVAAAVAAWGYLLMPAVVSRGVPSTAPTGTGEPAPPARSERPEVLPADQHFSGCNAARAAGRENIPASDPSYRSWMDGDGDGLACEPYP